MCTACDGNTSGGYDLRFFGVMCTEGFLTGDGRSLAVGALQLDALPLPLPFSAQLMGSAPGHDNSHVVGVIEKMERKPSTLPGAQPGAMDIWYSGHFSDSMEGYFAAAMAETATRDGRRGYDVSIDPDRISYEVRLSKTYAEQSLEEMKQFMDSLFAMPEKAEDLGEVNADGSVTVSKGKPDDYYMVMTKAELRSVTMVRIGAMSGGWVALGPMPTFVEVPAMPVEGEGSAAPNAVAAEGEMAAAETAVTPEVTDAADLGDLVTLAASGGPVAPPSAWFDDPHLDGPTPMTISPEGRLYGHLALWGTCHTSYASRCVTPPRSRSYSRFHNASAVTAEGETRAVGSLVMGGGHAPLHLNATEVMALHADASQRVASMRCGEDQYGIWCAGAVLPDVTMEQVVRLRSSSWSGHWNGGNLTIALAVNSPGFPVPVQDRVVARALAASFGEEPEAFISEPWSSALVASCGCSCEGECNPKGETEASATPAPEVEAPVEESLATAEEMISIEPDPALMEALEQARALMEASA